MMREWPRHDFLRHRAATTPDKRAVIDTVTDTHLDWSTLDGRVGRLATTLAEHVDEDDRVGILMETGQDFVEVFWSIVRLGASPVPVNPDRPPEAVGNRFRRATVTCVICNRETVETARQAVEGPVLSVDPIDESAIASLQPGTGVTPPASRGFNDELTVMFTSGTTGEPKGVRLTDGNLFASTVGSIVRLGIHPEDRWLCCLPMYHMGGLAPIIRTAITGTTLVLQPTFATERTARIIDDAEITGMSLVPTLLRRLLDANWTAPPHLETVLLGGAPAGKPLVERALTADIPVYTTYGLTEAASQVATAPPSTLQSVPDTVGRPLLVTDVTIVDDGEVCAPGEVGEVIVDGPTVAPAYLDRETTAEASTDRGLATGDLGSIDDAGRLTIHGRLDDRIITGGETVVPTTVVETLTEHPAIQDAAVVGLDDPEWGQRVAALVVTTSEPSLTTDEIRRHCKHHLAGFECPHTIGITETLPRTESGTIDRAAVRNQLQAIDEDGQV